MNSTKRTGGEAIVQVLERSNVSTVFGIPGSHNLEIYERLRTSDLTHVMARHESGATRMAAGYSRVTDTVGIVVVTAGPGTTNVITALAEAHMASTPVLLVCPYEPVPDAFHALEDEQFLVNTLKNVTKETFVVTEASDVSRVFHHAFNQAHAGRPGPTALAVPYRVLEESTSTTDHSVCNSVTDIEANCATCNVIPPVTAAINDASKPLIVAGQGCLIHRTDAELSSLITALDAPIACTERAIGAVGALEQWYAGVLSASLIHPAAERALDRADLVIELGVRKHNHRTIAENTDAPIVGFSDEPLPDGVVGTWVPHLRRAINTLAQGLNKADPGIESSVLADGWEQTNQRFEEKLATSEQLVPGHIITALEEVVPDSAIISTDVGDHTNWLYRYWTPNEPYTFLNPDNYMSMGHGLPTAIGAKAGCPEQESVALVGDGSVQMNMTEFSVAVAEDLPITVIVSNNSHHGVMWRVQNDRYNEPYSVELPEFNYAAFAELCGGRGFRVTELADLEPTLRSAIEISEPTIVDVRTLHSVEP